MKIREVKKIMNPLQKLYMNYTENVPSCSKYSHAFDELYKHGEIHDLLDEFIDGVCEDEKKAFYTGFKTAVLLFTGAVQE